MIAALIIFSVSLQKDAISSYNINTRPQKVKSHRHQQINNFANLKSDAVVYTLSGTNVVISGSGSVTQAGLKDNIEKQGSSIDLITKVTIESGIISIGERSFSDCVSLISILIPETVEQIDSEAFSTCIKLESIAFPAKLKSIPSQCCYDCISLKQVTLPNGLDILDSYCFFNCSSLLIINLPSTLTKIYEYVFCDCHSIQSLEIPDTVDVVDEAAFIYCYNLTSCKLPESIQYISPNLFLCCYKLISINIPSQVKNIYNDAFTNCTSLENVNIPASVSLITKLTFSGTKNLKRITVDPSNLNYSSDSNGILYNKDKTILIQCPAKLEGEFTVPSSVSSLGDQAFAYCANITKIILTPIDTIAEEEFMGCSSLKSITIPSLVVTIDKYAFWMCQSLKDIHYQEPVHVKYIEVKAFSECNSIVNMILPDSLLSFKLFSFSECSNMESVQIPASIQNLGGFAFQHNNKLKNIFYCGIWDFDNTSLVFNDVPSIEHVYVSKEFKGNYFCSYYTLKVEKLLDQNCKLPGYSYTSAIRTPAAITHHTSIYEKTVTVVTPTSEIFVPIEPDDQNKGNKSNVGLAVGVTIPVVILVAAILTFAFFTIRKKKSFINSIEYQSIIPEV